MTEDFLSQIEGENQDLRSNATQLQTAMSSSMYQGQQDNNLIQYQLESTELLERIEHFLKGDYIAVNQETGDQHYAKQENEDLVLFNEYGVNSIMNIIGNYIDKNTMLSYYDEERINEILADLGDTLADFIFNNYDRMGMTTEFKKSRYNMIVLNILHAIESTYRRALKGKEREEINSSRILTQSDITGGVPRGGVPKKRFNPMSPRTW